MCYVWKHIVWTAIDHAKWRKYYMLQYMTSICSHGSSVVSEHEQVWDAPIVDRISNEEILGTESDFPDSRMDEGLAIPIPHKSGKMSNSERSHFLNLTYFGKVDEPRQTKGKSIQLVSSVVILKCLLATYWYDTHTIFYLWFWIYHRVHIWYESLAWCWLYQCLTRWVGPFWNKHCMTLSSC